LGKFCTKEETGYFLEIDTPPGSTYPATRRYLSLTVVHFGCAGRVSEFWGINKFMWTRIGHLNFGWFRMSNEECMRISYLEV